MITVWRIVLDPSAAPAAGAVAEISGEERARAARYSTADVRNRWLHAHVAMRRILAREAGVAPTGIVYGIGAQGKPFLIAPSNSGIEFSLSDSGDLALLAVSKTGPVGVDLERIHPLPQMVAVARSHFPRADFDALLALPASAQLAAYFRLWTRKEAYLKGVGIGLGQRLDRFASGHQWVLRDLDVGAGYAASLAVEGRADVHLDEWKG